MIAQNDPLDEAVHPQTKIFSQDKVACLRTVPNSGMSVDSSFNLEEFFYKSGMSKSSLLNLETFPKEACLRAVN